ncbi:hypothetical protein DSO57_1008447 [Entomophthora muscae]|uniref:Uncharacterized protein n=1 Tax=Entomophthora muscae TaxID=34485 RepID=A0ACC2T7F5_9FUNG|nr:hypothetical protein DSO57_1008447 [Entomophthora muscae]
MNIFKSAFKMRRAGSQPDDNVSSSTRELNHQQSMANTKAKNYLSSLNPSSSQSQPNLSRPLIQSNFDPSVILHSSGISTETLPQPDECIQKALHLHEKGQLEEATDLLKIAASQNHPLGLFLLGISIEARLAFQCLQHSAESAIVDLNTIKNTDCSAAKHELTIAIHELGICFRHGWGVSRNKETAAYYFELAADLGDPDSQNELGHCYMYGEGVKRTGSGLLSISV